MAGGGGSGKAIGIAHIIMTGAGVTMTVSRASTMMWTRSGEGTTVAIIGAGTGGTMNGFPANDFTRTGGAGTILVIGKDKEPGVSKAINHDHHSRDRS